MESKQMRSAEADNGDLDIFHLMEKKILSLGDKLLINTCACLTCYLQLSVKLIINGGIFEHLCKITVKQC